MIFLNFLLKNYQLFLILGIIAGGVYLYKLHVDNIKKEVEIELKLEQLENSLETRRRVDEGVKSIPDGDVNAATEFLRNRKSTD